LSRVSLKKYQFIHNLNSKKWFEIIVLFSKAYPKEREFKDVKDATARIYIDGYRNRYNWDLTNIESFCKNQPNDCPLIFHKNYTMDASIFLSVDDAQDEHTAFGSRNVRILL